MRRGGLVGRQVMHQLQHGAGAGSASSIVASRERGAYLGQVLREVLAEPRRVHVRVAQLVARRPADRIQQVQQREFLLRGGLLNTLFNIVCY